MYNPTLLGIKSAREAGSRLAEHGFCSRSSSLGKHTHPQESPVRAGSSYVVYTCGTKGVP